MTGMKRRAAETDDRPANIILATQSQVSVQTAVGFPSQDALRRQIKRARRGATEREPQAISEIEIPDRLKETISGQSFVLKKEEFDGDTIIIFSSLQSMIKLCRSDMIIMDGTFKTCPLLFRQIYTLHGLVGIEGQKRCVPLVFTLMTSKREALYRRMLEILQEYCLEYGIDLCPRYVLTDFEMAIINAVRVKLPMASHRGCLFHLGQIIYRNVQAKGLQRIYSSDGEFSLQVGQLVALAFLPPDDIPAAFDLVKDNFDRRGRELIKWFERYYVAGHRVGRARRSPQFPPSMWSVAELMDGGLPRSQNNLEAWHRRFGSLAHNKHLGVIKCIELFREEEHSVSIQIERLEAGMMVQSDAALSQREARIKAVYRDRENRTTSEFLRSLAHNIKFQVVVVDDREEDEEEEDN